MRVLYPGRIGIWSVGFCGGWKTGESGKIPQSKARTYKKLNPHMATDQNQPPTTSVGDEHSHHCAMSVRCWKNFPSLFTISKNVFTSWKFWGGGRSAIACSCTWSTSIPLKPITCPTNLTLSTLDCHRPSLVSSQHMFKYLPLTFQRVHFGFCHGLKVIYAALHTI